MRLTALPAFDDNYIWALADDDGNAVIVDPGDAAPVLAAADQGLWPAAVLITHHHADHCGGLAALRQRWPTLPVYSAPDDARIELACERVRGGQVVQVNGWRFEVLEVPGHTRSHIAFLHPGEPAYLFSGDTLFSLGCGRLFEGTPAQMLASLDRLAALPGTPWSAAATNTLSNAAFAAAVDPRNAALRRRTEEAHAMRTARRPTLPSQLAQELACNPFLRLDQPDVAAALTHRLGRPPQDRVEAFAELRRWKDSFRAHEGARTLAPLLATAALCLGAAPQVHATETVADAADAPSGDLHLADDERNGREIFDAFRSGLADADCDSQASDPQWEKQFGHVPRMLADDDADALPMFGYVVDALRDANLPTEFALIPFVESGYRPAARNGSGPAGLWQFIGLTARNHGVAMAKGYDGRLSPVDSTQAAIRYLKTLYGMFGGDWRLATMAYNAGEYRVLKAMQRAGSSAASAHPERLPGLSPVTYRYVQKLHALACVFERAADRDSWLQALQRPVPRLAPQTLPKGSNLTRWAGQQDQDPDLLKRLNPALPGSGSTLATRKVLAPTSSDELVPISASSLIAADQDSTPQNLAFGTPAAAAGTSTEAPAETRATSSSARSHKVQRGESLWTIARRYGVRTQDLLTLNQLGARAVIKPGMVLRLEAAATP